MPVNKRNYRRQTLHLKILRSIQNVLELETGERWNKNNGRKKETFVSSDYAKRIIRWSQDNPGKSKQECAAELGIHPDTVTRWWNTYGQYPPKKLAVMEWKKNHPGGNKSACAKDLQFSRVTVTKYWE